MVSSVVSDEYQEEEHPRDMHGKWTSGDQTESPAFKSWFGPVGDGLWENAKTSRRIEATVVGWRALSKTQR